MSLLNLYANTACLFTFLTRAPSVPIGSCTKESWLDPSGHPTPTCQSLPLPGIREGAGVRLPEWGRHHGGAALTRGSRQHPRAGREGGLTSRRMRRDAHGPRDRPTQSCPVCPDSLKVLGSGPMDAPKPGSTSPLPSVRHSRALGTFAALYFFFFFPRFGLNWFQLVSVICE